MHTATEAWLDSIVEVKNWGNPRMPRGIETKEVLNLPMFFNMNYPVVHHEDRKLNYSFMAAEAYWITSGSPLVEDIAPYNFHISQYSDDGYIFNGAYGPAFLSQVNFIVETLWGDHLTRQAVMTIWHPNPIETKDHKCTIALQFVLRDGAIHTTVFMRSNDLFLGRPYDVFNFTIMTLKILTLLNTKSNSNYSLGTMCLHAVSSHIYYSNYEAIELILQNRKSYITTNAIPVRCHTDWQYVAHSLLACRDRVFDVTDLWDIKP